MKDKRISIKMTFDKGADTSIIQVLKDQGFKNFDCLYHDAEFPQKGEFISHVSCDKLTEEDNPCEFAKTMLGRVEKIIKNDNIDWGEKYHLIFSDDISGVIHKTIHLDYCDPDTSYEEDVMAFRNALEEYINKNA